MKYISVPRYRVRPSPGRFLFDRFLILLGLGILLYIGVFVNFYLLGSSIPPIWNWLLIFGILLVAVMEMILCYVRYGNYAYEFYDEKLVMHYSKSEEVTYSSIIDTKYHTGIFDRWFKTGTILITTRSGKVFKLRHLTNPNQAYVLVSRHIK